MEGHLIDRQLCSRNLVPRGIFCTHGHADHLGSAHFFQTKYNIPFFIHAADVRIAKASNLFLAKTSFRITLPRMDHGVGDGSRVTIGDDDVCFEHVPGHTPGSCLLRFRNAVFTGDTIYRYSTGHNESPVEDKRQLRESILRVWHKIPDECPIFPGHGKCGSFAEVKRENRSLRDFLGLAGEAARI